MKYLDPNKIKINEQSYKNAPICFVGYVTVKSLSEIPGNSLNPLYHFINRINGYI